MSVDPERRSALIIVDLQRGLMHGPVIPHEGERVVERTMWLIERARRSDMPIVFVQYYGPSGSPIEQGAKAWELIDGLDVQGDDIRIQKMRPSIFFGTDLAAKLKDREVGRLILVGMKTQYCIDTSCRIGCEIGFKIVLAQDAHTTVDGPQFSAKQIINYHNDLLRGPFAEVMPADQIVFS